MKQLVNGIRVYSRHGVGCNKKPEHLACNCPKWLQWQQYGKQHRQSADTRSFASAQKAAERKAKELSGEIVVPKVSKVLEEAVNEWLADREKTDRGNGRVKRALMGRRLLAWATKAGVNTIDEITGDKLIQFRSTLPYRTGDSSSLKIHWSVIGGFFTYCLRDAKLITVNPMPRRKIKFKPLPVVPPTPQQVEKIIAAVNQMDWDEARKHRVRLFIQTMRWSGMAIRDAATLQRDKLTDTNLVRGNRCKTNERFRVRIPAWLASELRDLPCSDPECFFWHLNEAGKKQTPDAIVHRYESDLRKVFAAAGVKMTPHGFRHFFISQTLASGASVDDVSKMVGTNPPEIRKTYEHWIKEAEDRLDEVQSRSFLSQGLDERGNPVAPATIH